MSTLSFASLPPFARERVKDYKNDSKKTEFRKAVREAVDFLDKQYRLPAFLDSIPLLPENQQARDAFLANIQNIQKTLATTIMADLDRQIFDLKTVGDYRPQETKLWQASYDYTMARLLMRQAYVTEYQMMLAQIKGGLPPFKKDQHKGFKLASRPK